MKAAILTLALAMFLLGASLTYVTASGGFSGLRCLIYPRDNPHGTGTAYSIRCE